ncbi:MAG: hypothetical protein GC185_12280 [Alphaproteobacteria bacterium]|nr:hypothetical protein [Alphaproteobacteria bacterium]
MMRRYAFILFAAFALAFLPARHAFAQFIQTSPLDLKLIAVGTVVDVPRENLIKIDNGAVYHLENVRIPVNYFPVVIEYLKKELVGKKVGIYADENDYAKQFDDGAHKLGHVLTIDGTWVQADLVSQGLAWVDSSIDSRDLVEPLYKYEDAARKKKLGLWTDPQYMMKDSQTIQNTYGSFQVFQGTVRSVAVSKDYIFINFGDNYKKDFSIVMKRDVCRLFNIMNHNLDPRIWQNRIIRIRGWVERHNGPMIRLNYPEQVEYPETGNVPYQPPPNYRR